MRFIKLGLKKSFNSKEYLIIMILGFSLGISLSICLLSVRKGVVDEIKHKRSHAELTLAMADLDIEISDDIVNEQIQRIKIYESIINMSFGVIISIVCLSTLFFIYLIMDFLTKENYTYVALLKTVGYPRHKYMALVQSELFITGINTMIISVLFSKVFIIALNNIKAIKKMFEEFQMNPTFQLGYDNILIIGGIVFGVIAFVYVQQMYKIERKDIISVLRGAEYHA